MSGDGSANRLKCPAEKHGAAFDGTRVHGHGWSGQLLATAFAAVAVFSGCTYIADPASDQIWIEVDDKQSRISIVAKDVSRARLLHELRTRHGIEIRTVGLSDERISVQVVDKPLPEALARLLPKDTPYVLRVGDREAAIAPPERDAGKVKPVVRDPKLPTKDEPPTTPPPERPNVKVPFERWEPPPPRDGPGLKPVATSVENVPRGQGAKQRRSPTMAERTGRLNFVITAPSRIRLIGAAVVDGSYVATTTVRGPLLAVVRDAGGKILIFDTLLDPLEMHSHREDGTPYVGRAEEGAFGLWVPMALLDPKRAGALILEFYDARAVTLPAQLDTDAVSEAIARAPRLAAFPGETLLEIFNEAK